MYVDNYIYSSPILRRILVAILEPVEHRFPEQDFATPLGAVVREVGSNNSSLACPAGACDTFGANMPKRKLATPGVPLWDHIKYQADRLRDDFKDKYDEVVALLAGGYSVYRTSRLCGMPQNIVAYIRDQHPQEIANIKNAITRNLGEASLTLSERMVTEAPVMKQQYLSAALSTTTTQTNCSAAIQPRESIINATSQPPKNYRPCSRPCQRQSLLSLVQPMRQRKAHDVAANAMN
jgi:hypothetical protein